MGELGMGALPAQIEELLDTALVGELTVLDERGRPVTHPLIPLYDGETIFLTSSVLFSKKLEYIKANPKVSLSITDPKAVNVERFRRTTIQGDARVDDADLHSGWERILPLWRKKEPAIDFFLGKRVALPLFFERGIIEVTPRRAFLWEEGDTSRPPQVFEVEPAAR
jgi:general stress protein 26